jgi:F0F1-type ATP synthase membrane subunit b/b'
VVTIVLFDGRVLPVTDMQQQRAEARKLADFIVKATGASLVENIGTAKMGAAKQGGRYTFKPLTYNDSGFNSIFAKIIAFIMILVLSAFIVMSLYFFATRG